MSESDQIEEREFTCPKCGLHSFGTSNPGGGSWEEVAEGECHGAGCTFTWLRKDDAKYFRGTGKFRPRSVSGTVRRPR